MMLVFLMWSFRPAFSLSSFTFIKRVFGSSLLSCQVVSSAYLKLLVFLPTILFPACDSQSPVFLMMYSAYKLNDQGGNTALAYSFPNLEPVHCSMSSSNCCFLSTWKFSVHILLKPKLKDFEYYLVSIWNKCNYEVVWTFFDIALLLGWNENWHFPVLWPVPVNSRYFLTSYFCIPVPCDEKAISFFAVGARRSCRSSWNCSASSKLAVGT